MRTLYILSHDLRLENNKILQDATKKNDIIFPIFLKDSKLEKLSGASLWWVKSSLTNLANKIGIERIPIVESSGSYIPVLKEIINVNKIERIVSQRIPFPRVKYAFNEINDYFLSRGIENKMYEPNNLLSDEMISTIKINFGNFGQFFKTTNEMRFDYGEEDSTHLPEFHETEGTNGKIEFSSWERNLAKYWDTSESAANLTLKNLLEGNLEKKNTELSPYIRHGQINVKRLWKKLSGKESEGVDKIRRNLLWREFFYCSYARRQYSNILSINEKMENFPWSGHWDRLINWKEGKTGFPIIDGSMRKLWEAGWIDNRKRLLVSDFLTKLYLIKWTYGAEWFMDTLVDADEANNYSSWQWVSGCSDFSWPFFRIFNPLKNSIEIDPNGEFIKKWVKELDACPVEFIHDPENSDKKQCKKYRRSKIKYREMRKESLSIYREFKRTEKLQVDKN